MKIRIRLEILIIFSKGYYLICICIIYSSLNILYYSSNLNACTCIYEV